MTGHSGRSGVNGELQHISGLSHCTLPLPPIPLPWHFIKRTRDWKVKRTRGKSPPKPNPTPPGSQKSQGRGHRRPLGLLLGGTMNWQPLWLGFLLPMTVTGRALGPAEKEAAVVSPLGKKDPGQERDWGYCFTVSSKPPS